MNFSEEELAMMSPSERDIAQQIMAAAHDGRDVLAEIDRETEDTSGAQDQAPTPDAAAASHAPANPPSSAPPAQAEQPATAQAQAEPPAAAPATAAEAPQPAQMTPPPQSPQMPTYTVDTTAVQAQLAERAQLREKIASIDQKWADGEITTEERLAQLTPLQDRVDTINGNLAVTQALAAANQQSIEQAQRAVIADIMERGAAIGLNYSTTKVLQQQFDAVMQALDADPANSALTFAQLAERAHLAVAAANGKAIQAAASSPAQARAAGAPTPPTRHTPPAPPTLRDMPGAQLANEGFAQGTLTEQVLSGDPIQNEENWNRLTKAQREALLR